MIAQVVAFLSFLLAPTPVVASEPCALVAGSDRAVRVRLTAPAGAIVAGATVVVDHPETKVGIAGEGTTLPAGTISGKPGDAMAAANDLGGEVRVVIARPAPFDLEAPVFTLHYQPCDGAVAARVEDFVCTVADASDPAANSVRGVGCTVVMP